MDKNNPYSTKKFCLEVYEQMLLLRKFEEKTAQLYGMQYIAGFCHLYIGQEAVGVGAFQSKKPYDSVITSYRCHAHAILSGLDPKVVMSELLGKISGSSKGKGGSMHIFNIRNNFYGGHGIVGAQVSLGTGIAFKEKYFNSNNICYTFFGDGAAHQGQVYESFNMAKLWNLPVLYIIENNEYSMGTSVKRCSATENLSERGKSFGIPGIRVNGMSILDVYKALLDASEYVRQGNGPMLVEMKTYRYKGHSMSDPAKYRTKEEVESYKLSKDPIDEIRLKLIQDFKIKEEIIKNIDSKIKSKVKESAEFAINADQPTIDELYRDIYIT